MQDVEVHVREDAEWLCRTKMLEFGFGTKALDMRDGHSLLLNATAERERLLPRWHWVIVIVFTSGSCHWLLWNFKF